MDSTTLGESRRSWRPDAAIAVGLAVVAFLLRRRFPKDGWFFDDAWQALLAVEGSFSELFTVGQTQPGFGVELMVWSRLIGPGDVRLAGPALIAGTLGPPALYLVLRRFDFARSISVLLAAALTASATHIVYSSRVKAYTTEVLLVLLLCVVVPRLARRQWRISTAVIWFAVSVFVAFFSSFTLLASSAAGLILVLHARGDLKLRLAAVGAQAIALVAVLAAVERTHNAELLTRYFEGEDGYIDLALNPLTLGREIGRHFMRVTAVFPGGPAWVPAVGIFVAILGLALAAFRHGARAVAARFMLAALFIAFAGALVGRVPFGPDSGGYRASLWLVPMVAFGFAVVLERVRRGAAGTGGAGRRVFDVVAVALSVVILLSPIGVRRPYPSGARLAARQTMELIEPGDAVLITRPTMYSFALYADTPVRVEPSSEIIQGYLPGFADERLHAVDFLNVEQRRRLEEVLRSTDVVYVVDSGNAPAAYKEYRFGLAVTIKLHGFEVESTTRAHGASITRWSRTAT